jgi:DNA mismatch repair ATPase MutS
MYLDVDKQTLTDLALFPNGQQKQSVLALLGKTKTIGGHERLSDMFNNPLCDTDKISDRIAVFVYMYAVEINFNIDKNTCDFAEFYLKGSSPKKKFTKLTSLLNQTFYAFKNNNDRYVTRQGVLSVIKLLQELQRFADRLTEDAPALLLAYKSVITAIYKRNDFEWITLIRDKAKLTAGEYARADHLFRNTSRDEIKSLLDIIYQLDVYLTVSTNSKARGFTVPVITENNNPVLAFNGLFHPFIEHPINNNIDFNTQKNICFVTGTNMAGKSTLLKAMGIAVYLSQLGFPVPAASMTTSLFKGLISTINLSDDIDQGHSHFYREVLRVKKVAQMVNQSKHVFVIFDELFRGTNVKDAFDASSAIIEAFAGVKSCFFVVSTHIVEVAHQLAKNDSINFRYMETAFSNDRPFNSYLLKEGITEERLGMWTVKNERILEIIKGIV